MRRNMRSVIVGVLLMQASMHGEEITSANGLLRAMHDRYAASWYDTLIFTQKSTTYNPDGTTKIETWYEAAMLPGKLRIDIGPPSDGRAYLMVDGTATIFQQGKQVRSRPLVNMLLVLGFDVYKQPAEATEQIVRAEKYDLSKFHKETWEGRAMYVVGADRGDLKSPQFWVDEERLLFVRLFQPGRADATKTEEIRFEDYRPLAGGWVAARVEIWSEGKMVFTEEYSDIRANQKLDARLFDPKQFSPERRP
jgi:hypothetical protein